MVLKLTVLLIIGLQVNCAIKNILDQKNKHHAPKFAWY